MDAVVSPLPWCYFTDQVASLVDGMKNGDVLLLENGEKKLHDNWFHDIVRTGGFSLTY